MMKRILFSQSAGSKFPLKQVLAVFGLASLALSGTFVEAASPDLNTAKDLKVVDDKKVDVTLVIAPNCRLGEHHLRIRCRSGISYARNFWVSQFPNVAEVEPNDDFALPQKISMNVTIEGKQSPRKPTITRFR